MSQAVEIEGMPALLRVMREIGDDKFADKTFKQSLMAGARLVRTAARANAPVRKKPYPPKENRKPGTLKRRITTRVLRKKPGRVGARVVSRRFYSRWLEFGTKTIAPRNFMKRSFDQNKAGIISTFRSTVAQSLGRRFLSVR